MQKHQIFNKEITVEDKYGRNVLHNACINEDDEILPFMLHELNETNELFKGMLHKKDNDGLTLLLLAVRKGNKTNVEKLTKTLKQLDMFDTEIFAEDEDGYNALHLACFYDNEDILTFLLTELKGSPKLLKKMLRKQTKDGLTPLFLAAQKENVTIFEKLSETLKEHKQFYVEISAEDEHGYNIFHRVCFNQDKDIFTFILKELDETADFFKKMLQKRIGNGLTLLLLAAQEWDVSFFEKFAKTLKELNLFDEEVFAENEESHNVLHLACFNRNEDVFMFILMELNKFPELLKGMLQKKTKDGLTPLFLAAKNEKVKIFKKIIETMNIFDEEISASENGYNILHHCVCFNQNEAILNTVLTELNEKGNAETLKRMLEEKDKDGLTPLLLAAQRTNAIIFKKITETLKDLNIFDLEILSEDMDCYNILHLACFNRDEEILTFILTELNESSDYLKRMFRNKTKDGLTLLLLAARKGNMNIFKKVMKKLKELNLFDLEIFAENEDGRNILHQICFNRNEKIFTFVLTELNKNKTTDSLRRMLQKKDKDGLTPLLFAAQQRNSSIFKKFTKTLKLFKIFDMEIFAEDENGYSTLHLACFNRNVNIFSFVLKELNETTESLKRMLQKKTKNGLTLLLLAARKGNMIIFKELMEMMKKLKLFEVEIFAEDDNGYNILHHVCFNQDEDILTIILMELNKKETTESLKRMIQKKTNDGLSLLFLAARMENLIVFKKLTEILKELNLFDVEIYSEENGCNILHRVSINQSTDILVFILTDLNENAESLKRMLQMKNKDGLTPLLLAAQKGNVNTVKILTDKLKELNI